MPFIRSAFLLFLLAICYFPAGAQSSNCPPNLDFETGTYANWRFYTGTCCGINTPNQTPPVTTFGKTRHVLTTGTGVDYYGGFPVVGAGAFSLKLGNDSVNKQAERARYYLQVPKTASTYVLIFRYAVVFQDPSHPSTDQPRFEVSAYDSASGDKIPCSDVTYISGGALPGFKLSGVGQQVWYKDWSAASIFLGDKVAGKTVAVDFATGDCGQGQHFGYGYIDLTCDVLQLYYDMTCSPQSTVTLTGPPGFQSYEWLDSAMTTTLGTTQTFITKVPDSTEVYALILTPYANFGCKDTLFAKIANLRIFAPKDTLVCFDGKAGHVQLKSRVKGDTGPFTYNWYPPAGLSCTNCPDPIAYVSATSKYYVTVTDTNGCVKMDSTTIRVGEAIHAKINVTTDTVCQFDPLIAENIVKDNPAGTLSVWDVDAGNITFGANTHTIGAFWGSHGLKKIIVTSAFEGCVGRDTFEVFVKERPEASFEIKYNVCLGEETSLYTKPTMPDCTYEWKVDEQSFPDDYVENRTVVWNTLGKKRAYLKVSANNGCYSERDTSVRVHDYPVGKIVARNHEDLCAGDTMDLSTNPGQFYTYEWSPQENMIGSNTPEVKAAFTKNTMVKLNVITQWGCNTVDSIPITTANCCKVLAPDAFTPNDDGYNDKFKVVPQGYSTTHTFIVTNRWGNIIYDSQSSGGWDGTYKGVPQDPGMYNYYIKFICNSGKMQEAKGSFLLIK